MRHSCVCYSKRSMYYLSEGCVVNTSKKHSVAQDDFGRGTGMVSHDSRHDHDSGK